LNFCYNRIQTEGKGFFPSGGSPGKAFHSQWGLAPRPLGLFISFYAGSSAAFSSVCGWQFYAVFFYVRRAKQNSFSGKLGNRLWVEEIYRFLYPLIMPGKGYFVKPGNSEWQFLVPFSLLP
jgi:hypothetical protein